MILEIACFSFKAAEIAWKAGADRIELCNDYDAGGISPQVNEVRRLKGLLEIPVYVMIRKRSGNFVCDRDEILHMAGEIERMKLAGADGFVFGILKQNNELNVAACRELIGKASPLPCTLHRAFDETNDPVRTVDLAADCGFKRILTSGGPGNAEDNLPGLKKLAGTARGRIIIMPGGGIRGVNIGNIIKATGAPEYHSACITPESNLLPDPAEISLLRRGFAG